MVRFSDASLHYYVNGLDQGLAASNCPTPVWGVVDLYGMAVKVTIMDRSLDIGCLNTCLSTEPHTNSAIRQPHDDGAFQRGEDILHYHTFTCYKIY